MNINSFVTRIFLLLIVFAPAGMHAQINRAWVGDTAKVTTYIGYLDDTSHHLKPAFLTGEWILYYDKELTRKAVHITYNAPRFDSCWYSHGQLRQAWVPQPYCPNCPSSELWYRNGQQEFSLKCNDDSCIVTWWYPSGHLRETSISRVVEHQRQLAHYNISYYDNGQLQHSAIDYTAKSKQRVSYYYESGRPMLEATLVNGRYYGDFTQWYDNGQLMTKGQYKKRRRFKENEDSYRKGKWSYYTESGTLGLEEFYKKGKLVRTKQHSDSLHLY